MGCGGGGGGVCVCDSVSVSLERWDGGVKCRQLYPGIYRRVKLYFATILLPCSYRIIGIPEIP